MTVSPEKIAEMLAALGDDQFAGIYRTTEVRVIIQRAILTELTTLRSQLSGITEETSSDLVKLREKLNDILDEDAPNKWVWKTQESMNDWLTDKVLPALRACRSALASDATTIERLTAESQTFEGIAKSKLESVTSQGWKVCGYAIEKDGEYGLVTTGAFVGWWSAADANARAAEARALAAEERLGRYEGALKQAIHDIPSIVAKFPSGERVREATVRSLEAALQSKE